MLAARFARDLGAVREHRFHPTRRWRFDFAWPLISVALEVEGAVWVGGRHTRGSGFLGDMTKYNTATLMGWRVLRTTWAGMADGTARAMVIEALKVNKEA
jgi:hypothetical protein